MSEDVVVGTVVVVVRRVVVVVTLVEGAAVAVFDPLSRVAKNAIRAITTTAAAMIPITSGVRFGPDGAPAGTGGGALAGGPTGAAETGRVTGVARTGALVGVPSRTISVIGNPSATCACCSDRPRSCAARCRSLGSLAIPRVSASTTGGG